jgi:bisphosphoglycerate-independent phosphoglycerate mutase (AlkP superfamily)
LRDLDALRNDRALAADLTTASWRERLNLSVPTRSPMDAAAVLSTLTRDHALTLFEYFLTDKAGHGRIETPPASLLTDLDRVLGTLADDFDPAREALVVTSDHGNLEEMSHARHTRNPVPLVVYGWAAPFFRDAQSLVDVTPSLVAALRSEGA